MGCLNQRSAGSQEGDFISSLREVITSGPLEALKERLRLYNTSLDISSLNAPLFHQKSLKLSALSLALYSGNLESFRYLSEALNLSTTEMEQNLKSNNTSSFHILCEKNYTDLLEHYIPVYLASSASTSSSASPQTPSHQYQSGQIKAIQAHIPKSKSPVQLACELGHISTLITLHKSFSSLTTLPSALSLPYFLNIHHIDESSGENCVFIACRQGNYLMLRCLNEMLKADFYLKNFKGEDCLAVLINICMDKGKVGFVDCLAYLLEVVKIVIAESSLNKLANAKDSKVVEVYNRNFIGSGAGRVMQTFDVEGLKDSGKEKRWDSSLDFDSGKEVSSGFCFDSDKTGLSSISPIEGANETSGVWS